MTDIPTGYPGAPPGWYPDPAGGPGQRWWDGYAWTETVVLPAPPPPPFLPPPPATVTAPPAWTAVPPRPGPTPANAATIEGLVSHEMVITRAARIAAVMPAVSSVINLILLQVNAAQFRTIGHQFHLIYIAAQNGQTAPTFANTPGLNPITPLVALLSVAALIVSCIWQFRAASAARAMGRPATHSPGWGVGSWFVPVVNLFMPYQAVRDCLDPGDPQRSVVLQWWLILVASGVLGGAAALAAFFSQGVALGFSIPAALVAVLLSTYGPRVVGTIAASHQRVVNP